MPLELKGVLFLRKSSPFVKIAELFTYSSFLGTIWVNFCKLVLRSGVTRGGLILLSTATFNFPSFTFNSYFRLLCREDYEELFSSPTETRRLLDNMKPSLLEELCSFLLLRFCEILFNFSPFLIILFEFFYTKFWMGSASLSFITGLIDSWL